MCNNVILSERKEKTVSLLLYFTARLIEMGNRFIKRRMEQMRQDLKAKVCFGKIFIFIFIVE